MKKFFFFYCFSLSIFASDSINIDDIEKSNLNVKTSEISQNFKDIAKDLIEIKKRQFDFEKKLDDIQEKTYNNEKKLKIIELIIEEQKSLIKDLINELNLKKEQKVEVGEVKEEIKKIEKVEKIERFNPTAFILTQDSEILNSPNGSVVENWKKGKKFTAYERMGNFIKVSGIVSNSKWQQNYSNLWIDSEKFPLYEVKK